jgi:hypothetical protein
MIHLDRAEAEFRRIFPAGPDCPHEYAAAGFRALAKAREEMADAVDGLFAAHLAGFHKRDHEVAELKAERDAAIAGVVPKVFEDWYQDDGGALWWDTSMTGGEIAEPPSYIGGPYSSDWPFENDELVHLLWVPLPKLARSKP